MDQKAILEFKNVTKEYPGTTALDNVSLTIFAGEVHALVGENGAGKSTLIKTCTGATQPTRGKIVIDGVEFDGLTPEIALKHGIGAIYQEFNLVPNLSVADNVFLGAPIRNGLLVNANEMNKETEKLIQEISVELNPRAFVESLSVGYQQMVEILKALSRKSKVLIMDEPTAPLTNREVDKLMEIIRRLKASGVAIVYISHRMEEIFEIADRVTVLRDGQFIKTLQINKTDKKELIKLMIGRTLEETYPKSTCKSSKEVVFEARNVTGNGVRNISLKVYKGEILALGGLVGAGRTEFAQMVFGITKPRSGEMFFLGKKVTINSPTQASDLGIAYIPEDRKQQGVVLDMKIQDNISLSILNRISRLLVINQAKEKELVKEMKDKLRIKTPDLQQPVNSLSGGNQQKVVVAKWLAANPTMIIMDEPTRGIDVGTKKEIYTIMRDLTYNGISILMISSEMEELLGMADRMLILCEGSVSGELSCEEFSQDKVLGLASKVGG